MAIVKENVLLLVLPDTFDRQHEDPPAPFQKQ